MALTEAEIAAALADYQAARAAILVGGQSYTINTGGTNRVVALADLSFVESQITAYSDMQDENNDDKGYQIGAGW